MGGNESYGYDAVGNRTHLASEHELQLSTFQSTHQHHDSHLRVRRQSTNLLISSYSYQPFFEELVGTFVIFLQGLVVGFALQHLFCHFFHKNQNSSFNKMN